MIRLVLAAVLCAILTLPGKARAWVFDEFQVFDGRIAEPGAFDVNLHLNLGRRGRREEGGAPRNGLLLTPEIGYSTTPWHAVALYLPMAQEFGGALHGGGFKLRNSFVLPGAGDRPVAWGMDVELRHQPDRFSGSDWAFTLRPIFDLRHGPWQIILNPNVEVPFGRGPVVFAPALRGVLQVAERHWLGLEHYMDFGRLDRWETPRRQGHQLFLTTDWKVSDRFALHLGIGRGLSGASERWAGKLIVSLEF